MGEVDSIKKKIIFVISRMSIGGSQKSLVNALKTVDYEKNDVTLYVRENKTDLIGDLPKQVKVTVNTNTNRYEHTGFTLFLEVLQRVCSVFGCKGFAGKFEKKSRDYIVKKKTKYEATHYAVLRDQYDMAVSYLQGFTCKFTADCINADRMVCFFHNSTDGLPEIHREYLPRFEKIVVISSQTQAFLGERYPAVRDRILVIKNLIDVEGIKQQAKQTTIDKPDRKTVLCTCGRMGKEKGYDLAVNAAAALKERGQAFLWYFIGDGPEKQNISQMISDKKLDGEIVALGSRENPYPWISQCDIYVQPSYEESQSLTIMEAQLFRVPVVSTKTVGGLDNIVHGKNGIITDFNGESIADGILTLMEHTELMQACKEELKKKDFTAYNDHVISQWKALIEDEA